MGPTSCWRKKPSGWRRSIRLLRGSFTLVSLDEYLDALRAGRCRNLATLTFDDGLRNQLTVAHEVLTSLRVPATFYVCPALVGTPFSTWTWELEPRLSRLSIHRRQSIFARGSADSFEPFLKTLKEMPLAQREAIWDARSATAVARHFDSAVTMEPHAVGPAADPYRLPRVHLQWDPHEMAWILARAARD